MASTNKEVGKALELEMTTAVSDNLKIFMSNKNRYLQIPKSLYKDSRVTKLILGRIRGRFKAEGKSETAQTDPKGKKWKDLAPYTIAKGRTNRRKLFETGRLSRSIRLLKGKEPRAIESTTGIGIRIGVKAGVKAGEYARVQQQGGRVKGGFAKIPARPYLGIGKGDKLAVNKLIKDIMKKQGL